MITLFKYEGSDNDKYTYGDIYGIYQETWQKIHSINEWQMLSPIARENIFLNCAEYLPNIDILNGFTPFSLITYDNVDNQKELNISFVPKNQLLIAKDLINLDQINRILAININTIETDGDIYVLVTNGIKDIDDNIIYYTYDFIDNNSIFINEWKPVLKVKDNQYTYINDNTYVEFNKLSTSLEKFHTLTVKDLLLISPEYIEKLFPTMEQAQLGFAFLFVPKKETAELKINSINIDVEVKGIWESTQLGVDYTYNYPDSTHININIKNKGKYKINYYS